MCGIAGFTQNDPQKAQKILTLLQHRGPDDEGVFSDQSLTFAQVRLSILDLSSAGFQPMFYDPTRGACSEKFCTNLMASAKVGIVFNGEIYNFQEIRQKLLKKGFVFTTKCDTEVVLAAYLAWGNAFLNELNGMFAFALYDLANKKLILARDRAGEKPLYFTHQNGFLAFGSELKTILAHDFTKKIDPYSLQYYLLWGYTPNENSILEKVQKLPPAHFLEYDLEKQEIIKIEKYWEIKFSDQYTDYEEVKEKTYQLIEDSVRLRMIADVPVGAFLSGGVDSSIMVYSMRKFVKDLKTFSVGFDYQDFNESSWAKIVSKKFETDHYEIQFSAKDVLELVPKLPYFFDEPFGDSSMIPTFLVSKVAREQVTVCLSGTGGDELFGGYERYSEYETLLKLRKLPTLFHKLGVFAYGFLNPDKSKKLENLLQSPDNQELYLRLFTHLFRDKEEIEVDKKQLKELKKYFSYENPLTNALNFDQHLYLPDDLLVKEDRATMANSLEGRIPFLDHRLIEFANQISPNLKIQKGEKKFLLKKMFEGKIPNEILYRKKQGFGVPLSHYFRKELKDFAYSQLFDFQDFDYYDKKLILRLWDKHQSEKSDYSYLFWILINFNQWYKQWIKV